MLVTLQTAKQYLRVDSEDDDALIENLIQTSEKFCKDVLRLEEAEELPDAPEVLIAVLYALAYLYEHRENGVHDGMMMNLRSLLSGIRKEKF